MVLQLMFVPKRQTMSFKLHIKKLNESMSSFLAVLVFQFRRYYSHKTVSATIFLLIRGVFRWMHSYLKMFKIPILKGWSIWCSWFIAYEFFSLGSNHDHERRSILKWNRLNQQSLLAWEWRSLVSVLVFRSHLANL